MILFLPKLTINVTILILKLSIVMFLAVHPIEYRPIFLIRFAIESSHVAELNTQLRILSKKAIDKIKRFLNFVNDTMN